MHLSHLSRLLALLLGILYPGGACELDGKECKQNYGKESHDYVLAAAADAHDAALHLAPLSDAPTLLPGPAWRALWAAVVGKRHLEGETRSVPAGSPPRPRRYLRYVVLQI